MENKQQKSNKFIYFIYISENKYRYHIKNVYAIVKMKCFFTYKFVYELSDLQVYLGLLSKFTQSLHYSDV